ncbi:MAG TPA: sugar transferase [Bacillota bacterium]|nr:sugar transferase [Bacillota bacterium]
MAINRFLKRLLDIFTALLALLLLSPVYLVVALAILLDSGRPVIFVQQRVGLKGQVFNFYKFRSMKVNMPLAFNEDGSTQLLPQDSRLTGVGSFIRKYSLDELPQFWNVLMGSMSVVGPRPDLPLHYAKYTPDQRYRYSVKPGITGLAQVSGRNLLSMEEKVALDLEYIRNYSLLLDLRIMCLTLFRLVEPVTTWTPGKH